MTEVNKIQSSIDNFKEIQSKIEDICIKENIRDIQICAATKTVSADVINSLVPFGLKRIGENRLNELKEKYDNYDSSLIIDYIGTLQSNKIRELVGKVSLIQSMSTVSSAKELDRVSRIKGVVSDCLIEINSGRESNKSGIFPEMLDDFISQLADFYNIHVCGLMTVGAADEDYIKYFDETYNLYCNIKKYCDKNIDMKILSMGMSSNYIEAIKCGSNMVRPGRAIFGERLYTNISK